MARSMAQVVKVLALQAYGSEFDHQNICAKVRRGCTSL